MQGLWALTVHDGGQVGSIRGRNLALFQARKLLFLAAIPLSGPNYWEIFAAFAFEDAEAIHVALRLLNPVSVWLENF